MSDPVADIMNDVANTDTLTTMAQGDIGTATEQIRTNNAAIQASYDVSNARAATVASATKTIKETQNAGTLVAQTAIQNYAHALGVDPDGTLSAQQYQAQQTFLDASQRASDAAAVIAQKRSVSFFDDPLQWLSNKLTINDDINTFNGAATEANTAEQFIQDTNQLIDSRTKALTEIQTVTSQAAAEAQTQVAVAQAQETAEILRRQGIAANTQGIEAIQNMSWRNIQIQAAKTDADSKAFQVEEAQKRLDIANEQLDLEKQRLALQSKTEKEKNGANDYLVGQLRKGLQLMYPNNPEAWDIPDGKFQAFINGKVPLDPRWKKAFEVANSSDAIGGRVLGTSAADALETLSYKPVVGPSAQPTVAFLQTTAQQVMATPQYKQLIAAKDTKGAEDMINQAVAKGMQSQAQHVDSPTSLYYLPPIDKLAENIPGYKDSPFYQIVIAPASKAGVDLSSPGQVARQAVQAIKDGKITLNEAANNMSAMYGIGQQFNFEAKQINQLGIAAPPSYVTPVNGIMFGGNIGNVGTVDWTNETQVKEMMMRMSAINQSIVENPRSVLVGHTR